jgi:hypothetical protein
VLSRNAAAVAVVLLIGMSLAVSSLRFVEEVAVSSAIEAPATVAAPAPPPQTLTDVPGRIASSVVTRARSRVPATTSAAPQVAADTTPHDAPATTTSSKTPSHTAPDIEPPHDAVETATVEQASTPETPIPSRSIQMPPPQRVTPWGAAADAGVALGQRSKKGGQATAAFFTRLGKRVADSF